MQKNTIAVLGMMCASCASRVEKRLNAIQGVLSADVNLATRSVTVNYDESKVTLDIMQNALKDIGYDMIIEQSRSLDVFEKALRQQLFRKTFCAWIIAFVNVSLSMGWIDIGNRDMAWQLMSATTIVAMVWCGKDFYVNAYRQILHFNAGMDTLVALSTLITYILSVYNTFYGSKMWGEKGIEWNTYYDAVTMIIAFILTGRTLEERARHNTTSAIRALMALSPKTARVRIHDKDEEVPIQAIIPGDIIEVRKGENFPVDGTVFEVNEDDTQVDESMISGEPEPAKKRKGDKVFAGTMMLQGVLRFRAEKKATETVLAQIVKTVEQALGTKAPVQRIADRIAIVFVPIVVVIAVITLATWLIVAGKDSLPQAVLAAASVLVISCPCALGLATPTALTVGIGLSAKHNILIKDASAIENMAKIDTIIFDKTGTLTIPIQNIIDEGEKNLTTREKLKEHSLEAITLLQQKNVDVWLVSGDKKDAVKYWADLLGINNWIAEALPQDKERLISKMKSEGHKVAMVGDGINDSPALAVADVSIAMAKGVNVAIETAQITLNGGDLLKINDAIDISHKTVSTIKQNLFWAFIYNVICIPIAAGALHPITNISITPAVASALMALSSISVVLNSLRLSLK